MTRITPPLGGAGGVSHTILDGSTHTDTVAQIVSRGSLIYGNSTPKWDELVVGAANSVLWSNGTDVSWSASPRLASIADTGGTVRITLTTSGTQVILNNGLTSLTGIAGILTVAGNEIRDSTGAARIQFQGGVAVTQILGNTYFNSQVAVNEYIDANIRFRVYDSIANPSGQRRGIGVNQFMTASSALGNLAFAAIEGIMDVQINGAGGSVPQAQGMLYLAKVTTAAGISGTVTDSRAAMLTRQLGPASATTLTITNSDGLLVDSPSNIGAGTIAVTLLTGVRVRTQGLSGVITSVGMDIEAQSGSTTNIGLRNAGTTVKTPSAVQTVWNGTTETTMVANASVIMITATATRTLTNAPTIANGQNGQILTVINTGANAITIQDQGTLASSNLRLVSTTIALGTRDNIQLMYSSTVGDWVQIAPVTNVI